MRTTEDPKGTVLKVRLNEEMKNYLDTNAKRTGKNVSEYVREIIKKELENSHK